jgi:predicted O-methyltransferase YrrM
MKIAIGTPHAGDTLSGEYCDSLLFMVSKAKCEFVRLRMKSALVHKARNEMFETAANMDVDYLLMIDSDMVFPDDALEKLLALDKDICTGVYYKKTWPHRPEVYRWTGKQVFVHENYSKIPLEPFKVDSCGGGFLLISKKVLKDWDYKAWGKPFNMIEHDDGDGGTHIGEDTSFCLRCKDRFEIWAEPRIKLGHKGSLIIESDHWQHARNVILSADRQTDGIDGWTTLEELEWLAQMAVSAKNIVEIGSWKGRSTKVLLEASEGFVHAIDHFKGTDKDGDFWSGALAKEQDVHAEFMKNVGTYPNLRVHRMSSEDAVDMFDDKSLDLVFIDGDHTHKGVLRDIENYLPKVKPGGTICGHDYAVGWPGVVKAVDSRFDKVNKVGTIWYAEVA